MHSPVDSQTHAATRPTPSSTLAPAASRARAQANAGQKLGPVMIRGFVLIGLLLLFGWGFKQLDLSLDLDQAWLDRHLRGESLWRGVLWFAAAAMLGTAVGLPRQVFAFLGGYAYGWWWGGLLATLGTLAGAAVSFSYARVARRLLRRPQRPPRTTAIVTALRTQPFAAVLLVRLLPVGNNLVTNLLAGACRLPVGAFLAASALGYLPQSLIFALLGEGVQLDSQMRLAIAIVLFAAASLLGLRLYRRFGQTAGRRPPAGAARP